jgi:hypothetical protein
MNQSVSPLQLYTTRNFAGLTESNHLAAAYLTEPEKMEGVLAYAFGLQNNNVISLLTGGIGNTREITNREYQWHLHGQNKRAIEVVEDCTDGNSTPGIGGTTFRVTLAERWFELSDNLTSNDGTLARVQSEPYQNGAGWVYTLQLTENDPTKFMDQAMVNKGAKFSKRYSTVEEFSNKGGGVEYATPFVLRNQLTTLRKHYTVTRNASQEVMIMELYNPEDPKKSTKLWTKLAEWTALAQFYREVDESMIYSVYNKPNGATYNNLQGANGRPILTGAGLRQQIAPANVRYYSKLTYNLLFDFLMDLSYAANAWGGNHKFVALTGKMGMIEFDRAIREELRNTITIVEEGRFIGGEGQELEFKGQFKTCKFLNGIELTVKEFPVYDDLVANRALHPVSGRPIESYRFTILNFGRKDGKSNIRKVALKNSENAMWHISGSTDPYAGVAKSISTMKSSTIDGYEVHMLSECGIQIEDPTSCGELILNVDAIY